MNIRKTLFAVALSALAGSALAAPPATTTSAPNPPAKTTVTDWTHFTRALS